MMTVAALMQAHPETVSADLPVTMLERRFLDSGFSGFPVVDDDRLIGVVSRYDIVRSLITERSHAEQISEFYSTTRPICAEDEIKSLEATAAQVGVRIAKLRVEDVMTRTVISIDVSESIQGLASLMLEGHLHRLPVVSMAVSSALSRRWIWFVPLRRCGLRNDLMRATNFASSQAAANDERHRPVQI